MALFIAIVRGDGDSGYTASFPDFPGCAVGAATLGLVIARARETLLVHIERLVEANHAICSPTSADAIERGDALLIAAVDVPDDLRIVRVDVAIPALALARIDSFARRSGLARGALFVQAVDRWLAQETVPRERRGEIPDGPTLFDFGNPLELRVGSMAVDAALTNEAPAHEPEIAVETPAMPDSAKNITAELERLLEERSERPPPDGTAREKSASEIE